MAIISSSDLKTHLNIGVSDSVDDTSIGVAVNAANQAVVRWCGRSFDATSSGSESARVYRPRTPTLTITDDFWTTTNLAVKLDEGADGTYESTLTLNTDFIVEPLNGMEDGIEVPYRRVVGLSMLFDPAQTVPHVQVTAAWGWESVPDDVTLATLIKAARLFKRRTSPEGVLGGFQDYGAVRVSNREDPDVVALLAPYRRSERVFYT